jgi:glyoxylase I family protein
MSPFAPILASSAQRPSAQGAPSSGANPPVVTAATGQVSVRYQVKDVARAIAFYTEQLGFQLEQRSGGAFAAVVLGNLRLLLSGPGSSGSRSMPSGQQQEPGGWSRILIHVPDLAERIRVLRQAGVSFRNSVETGPGGSQIMLEDLDGNPVELHQPPPS